MINAPREAASARHARRFSPWLRRLATLAVLVAAVGALTPPPGQAFQGMPPVYFAAPAPASRIEAARRRPTLRQLLTDDYHPHPLRRVHRVTAYCDRGLTAAGVPSGEGQCAAPADLPFGAIVHIPELDRSFVVTDRTARRFRHNTVDIFIPSREDCLDFGLNYLECEVYLPQAEHDYGSRDLAEVVETFTP